MTLHDAVVNYQYDVSIYYYEDEYGEGWSWDINGGYSSVGGHNRYSDINEALKELINFLAHEFKPFEK
jgi:hypothetical protein